VSFVRLVVWPETRSAADTARCLRDTLRPSGHTTAAELSEPVYKVVSALKKIGLTRSRITAVERESIESQTRVSD
jgi:hypothetical protein